MSLLPVIFSDWLEDDDQPYHNHHYHDQYSSRNLMSNWMDVFEPFESETLLYRPRRTRRRYHPFLRNYQARKQTSVAQKDKDDFHVTLDVQQFAPDEIKVKVVDKTVIVEAKHEEKKDAHGWISREFVRKYSLPTHCDFDQVTSTLSSDGILSISAPKQQLQNASNEKIIKIQYTGEPAITNHDGQSKTSSIENEQSNQSQNEVNHQPSQQTHRTRKSNVKAA